MIKPPIRVACLGAGYFSQFHYDAWRRMDGAELVGSANRNIEKARATGAPAFSNLDEMLAQTTPDLLDIITPPPTHLEAVTKAVAAGVKAIICQKPFCENLEDAKAATKLATQAGIPLVIHENFRFQPWYRVMRDAIDAGHIGEVHQLTFRLRTGDGQGPNAYLDRQPYFQEMPQLLIHETGVHWIDTFRFLLGEPNAVYADLRRMNPVIAGEDAGYVVFDFENNVRAVFDGNRLLDHAAENHRKTLGEALLEGTQGTITLAGDGSVGLRKFGETKITDLLEAKDWPGFAGDCVYALQKHVISGLLDETPLENLAEDYLAVIKIEELVYRSAEERRKLEV